MPDWDFCQVVNKLLHIEFSQASLETIWNSFLDNIEQDKLHLMLALKDRFNLLILSNTNAIYQRSFNQPVGELIFSRIMSDIIHTAYYSYELGLRKPNPNIYERVIDLQNLNHTINLFFDDYHENINMAQGFGLRAIRESIPIRF